MDSVTVLEAMSGTRYAEFASTTSLGPTGPQADLVDCATVRDVLFIPIGVNGPRRRRRLPLRSQQEHGRTHCTTWGRRSARGPLSGMVSIAPIASTLSRCDCQASGPPRSGMEPVPPHLRSETNSRQDVLLVSDSIPEDLPFPEHPYAVTHTSIDLSDLTRSY